MSVASIEATEACGCRTRAIGMSTWSRPASAVDLRAGGAIWSWEALLAGAVLTVAVVVGTAAVRNANALSVLVMSASITLVVTGYLLRRDAEQARAGLLLYSAAVFLSLSDTASAFGPAAGNLAHITSWWAVPPLALFLLTYPGGKLARPWHGWLVIAVAVEFIVLWTAERLFALTTPPTGTPQVLLDAALYYGGLPLPVLACVALMQRWREAAPPERPAARAVTLIGLALCVTFTVRLAAFAFADRGPAAAAVHEVARILNLACLGVAPVGLLLETIRRRAAQRRMLEDLLRAGGDLPRVQASMARALRDPTVRLAFSVDGTPPRFVDVVGADVDQSTLDGPNRLLRELLSRERAVIGLVSADSSTESDPTQLRVVLAGAALALDNARLQASLLSSLEEVRRSRARIVEAGLRARRHLERDLHDGAQQQLLTVAASLARAEILPDAGARARAVAEARAQLLDAVGELRRLARGIHPAVLSQGGLSHALPTLADAAAVPVDVDIPAELRAVRLPMVVETTLWFVAAEAVTNALRHSAATRIRLRLRAQSGHVRLVVEDDGHGGARLVPGGGLVGLADRVAALGGELTVESPPAGGAVVEVVLPCAL
jgi:signal transduction histidine kinase